MSEVSSVIAENYQRFILNKCVNVYSVIQAIEYPIDLLQALRVMYHPYIHYPHTHSPEYIEYNYFYTTSIHHRQ